MHFLALQQNPNVLHSDFSLSLTHTHTLPLSVFGNLTTVKGFEAYFSDSNRFAVTFKLSKCTAVKLGWL